MKSIANPKNENHIIWYQIFGIIQRKMPNQEIEKNENHVF